MSTQKKASTSKFSIVRAISALLNLGDNGKLDSFLARTVKTLNTEAKVLTNNLNTLEFNHQQKLDSLEDSLEDAKETLAVSYLDIPVDCVETNAAQIAYMDTYLNGIEAAEEDVERLENRKERAIEAYDVAVKDVNEQVVSLNKRVKTIGKA